MNPLITSSAIALGILLTLALPANAVGNQNGPADGTQAQQRERGPNSEAFMERFDTNGDGQLSKEEKQAARDQLTSEGKGSRKQEQRQEQILEKFDTNGDGQLDETERKAVREQMKLRKFDADGDGQLSDAENAKAEEFREKMLNRFDKDGDGKLNKKEKMRARKAMQKHRKQGGGSPGSNGQGSGQRRGPPEGTPSGLPFLDGVDEE